MTAQKCFDLVKSSIFCALLKYGKSHQNRRHFVSRPIISGMGRVSGCDVKSRTRQICISHISLVSLYLYDTIVRKKYGPIAPFVLLLEHTLPNTLMNEQLTASWIVFTGAPNESVPHFICSPTEFLLAGKIFRSIFFSRKFSLNNYYFCAGWLE